MPTLGTGERSGFTLLEILAVILLIGLALTLVQPEVERSLEKTEIQSIGKLLCADLAALKESAVMDRSTQIIYFTAEGYHFQLGEHEIQREFSGQHLQFIISVADSENRSAQKESTASAPDLIEEAEQSPIAPEQPQTIIQFRPGGDIQPIQLTWRTRHFHGDLIIQEDGEVQWNYAPQSAGD